MHAVTICQPNLMTWILPKQLHTLASVQDMEALILDSEEQSQAYAQSLFLRSKVSRVRTWSAKWNRDSWMLHLSGRILKPSLGERFVTEWTSSLEVTHASHSHPPESDSAQTIPDTSGHTLQMGFAFFDPNSVFLKTSKDTLPSDSERSLANWNQWVTRCRGEYSQRVKLVRHTNASESSSWPTVTANEDSYRIGGNLQQSHCLSAMARRGELGHPAPVNPSTDLSHPGLLSDAWPTPTALSRVRDEGTMQKCLKFRQGNGQTTVPLYLEERVNIEEKAWETPTISTGGHRQADGSMTPKLDQQVKAWATPQSRDAKGAEGRMIREGNLADLPSQTEVAPTGQWNRANGKLNPRWVETLMGLPVGWVMPSCANPVTIAPTNCACSATELCQQPQP